MVRFRPRTLLTLFFLGVFTYVVFASADMPIQARLFPWTIGFIGLSLLLFELVRELLPEKERKDKGIAFDIAFTEEEATATARRKVWELFAWIYGFVLGLWLLGFHLAIFLMVLLYLIRHRETTVMIVTLPLSTLLVTWALFDRLLHLPFPPGQLVEWLGWR